MSRSSYSGDPLDGTVQYITERPELDDTGETVNVVDDRLDTEGEETITNVPVPEREPEKPDAVGQTTLDDWGWSA